MTPEEDLNKNFVWRCKAMFKIGRDLAYVKDWWITIHKVKPKEFDRYWEHYKDTILTAIKPTDKLRKKEYLQKNKECYFCNNKEVIEHHISYNPQRIIYLCNSCHLKVHFVFDEYHKTMVMTQNEKVE